jgi:hypothetical protein
VAVVSVAVCPHPPLLIPEVAAGAAYELDDLRAACDVAVSRMLERCDAVRLLASSAALPSAVDVGRHLLSRSRGEHPVTVDVVDGPRASGGGREGLLVMADGSARRTPKAPGAMHPDAEAFDRAVADMLATGHEPDLSRAAEMWCTSAPSLRELSRETAGQAWTRELLYEDAPYGVAYFVASWVPAGA